MISSWDDELVLVQARVNLVNDITVHESIILEMGRGGDAVPHRLDLVSTILAGALNEDYSLCDIVRLDAIIPFKEHTT